MVLATRLPLAVAVSSCLYVEDPSIADVILLYQFRRAVSLVSDEVYLGMVRDLSEDV